MKNKYTNPDNEIYSIEELELFGSLESDIDTGAYKPMQSDKLEEKKEFFKQVATNTIEKNTKKKSISLRIIENDIEKIKAIAMQKGLPYQTFLSSIVHQIATKEIKV
jgi:predicted DNA binding CopG/RHH family protein